MIYHLAFRLTMLCHAPLRSSWQDKNFVACRQFMEQLRTRTIAVNGPYTYRFSDGYTAHISAFVINEAQRNRLLNESDGFGGYEWMIDSIIKHGEIKWSPTSRT